MKRILLLLMMWIMAFAPAISQPLVTLTLENRHAIGNVYHADVFANVNGSWVVGSGNITVVTNSPAALNFLVPTSFPNEPLLNLDEELINAGYTFTVTGFLVPSINFVAPAPAQQITKTSRFRVATLRWNIVNATLADNAVFGDAPPNETVMNAGVGPLTRDCSGGTNAFCLQNPASRTINTVFPTPVLVTPADVSVDVPFAAGVNLQWGQVNVPGTAVATSYEYQVSQVSNFATTVSTGSPAGVENTSATITGLLPNTQYFWRVRATREIATGITTTSDWSVPFSFTTINFPQPELTIDTPPAEVCPTAAFTLNSSIVSGTAPFVYQWASRPANTPDPFVNVAGATGATLTVAGGITAATEYRLTVTDDNAQTGVSTASIGVIELPSVSSINGAMTVCQNAATVYSIPPTANNILWTVTPAGGVTILNGNSDEATITFTNPGAYTVSVEVSNSCATSTATMQVQVNQQPAPIVSSPSGSNVVCEGSAGHTYRVDNPTPGATYNWSTQFGSGTIISGQGTSEITVQWTAAGIAGFDAVNVVETVAGCSPGNANFNVTINRQPNAEIISNLPGGAVPTEVCAGAAFSLLNTQLPSGSPFTYSWSVSGPVSIVSGASTASVSLLFDNVTVAGMASITLTQSIAGCQTSSATVNINVRPAPAPVLTGPAEACSNTGGYVYNVSNNDAHNNTWSVVGGNITQDDGNSITVEWTAIGTGTVEVIQTSGLCGTSTVTLSVDVSGSLSPTITANTTAVVCSGQERTYTAENIPTGTGFQWAVAGNGTIIGAADQESVTVSWHTAGAGSIALLASSPQGCTGSSITNVTIGQSPNLALVVTGDDQCFGQDATITIENSQAGISYTVRDAGNTDIVSGNGNGGNLVLTVPTAALPSTQTFTIFADNGAGCSDALNNNATVVVRPLPDTKTLVGSTVCSNEDGTFTIENSQTGVTYNLTLGGTQVATGNGNGNDLVLTIQQADLALGTNTVSAGALLNGCTLNLGTANIVVNQAPNYALAINGDNVCAGENAVITIVNAEVGVTYSVRRGATTIVSGSVTSVGNLQLTVPSAELTATETFTVFADRANGCSGNMNVQPEVVVRPLPLVRTVAGSTICSNVNGTITIENSEAGVTYNVTLGGNQVATGNGNGNDLVLTIQQANLALGTNTVDVQAALAGCNVSLGTADIVVNQAPNYALAITGDNVCAGENAVITITNAEVGVTYSVRRGATTVVSGSVTSAGNLQLTIPTAQLTATETFTIFAERANGCSGNMNTQPQVVVRPVPAARTVVGSTVCSNVNGTVTIQNSEMGAVYTLRTPAGAAVGATLTGNGNNIAFSIPQSNLSIGANTFTVTAVLNACDATITTTAVVTVNAFPAADRMVANSTVCFGEAGTITIQNAEAGVQYSLRQGGATVVSAVAGGDGPLVLTVPAAQLVLGANTYVINADRLNGCDVNLNQTGTITVNPLPDAQPVLGRTEVCANRPETYSVNPAAGLTYAWTVVGGAIQGPAIGSTVSVIWNENAGIGQVTATATNNLNCSRPNTLNVTVSNSLTPPVIAGAEFACPGDVEQYSAPLTAGDSYTWTVVGGTFTVGATPNVINVTWGVPGVGTINLVQATPSGCTGESSFTVVKRVAPDPEITGPADVCRNATVTYSAPNLVGTTYLWTVVGGTITSGQGTREITVAWTSPVANGTVSVLQTAQNCSGTRTLNVSIDVPAVAVITGNEQTCVGQNETYNATARAGDTYQWSIVGGTIISGQGSPSVLVSWVDAGAASLTLVQNSPGACTPATATRNISVNLPPNPLFVAENVYCTGTPATYSVAAFNPTSRYTWTVSANGTIQGAANQAQVTVIWNTEGAGHVTLEEETDFCGTLSQQQNFVVERTPAPVITGIGTICAGEATTYSVPSVVSNTYNWSVVGGTIVSGQGTPVVSVRWDNAGIGSVSVAQNSPNCGSAGTSLNVIVNPRPQPIVNGTFTVCTETEYTYSTPAVAGNTYSWAVSGGQIIGPNNANSVRVRWTQVGNGTVSVQENSPTCGGNTEFRTVTVRPQPPQYTIQGSTQVCALTRDEVYSVPALPDTRYEWTVSGGAVVTGQGSSTVVIAWGNRGTGSVTVRYGEGCERTASLNINIAAAAVAVEVTGNANVCEEQTHTYQVNNVPGAAYTWVVEGGTIVSGQGTRTVQVRWTEEGQGGILVDVTGASSPDEVCPVRAGIPVFVNAVPEPEILGEDVVCANAAGVAYRVENAGSGSIYSWSVQGGTIVSRDDVLGTVVIDWGAAGTGSIDLIEETAAGCSGATSYQVRILAIPVVSFASDTVVMERGRSVRLESIIAGVGADAQLTYEWTPFASLDDATAAQPVASPSVTTAYVVTVSNEGLCTGSAEVVVRVDDPVSVGEQKDSGFFLSQNFPNPANGATQIKVGIVKAGQVSLELKDVSGRTVATLLKGNFAPGVYDVTFDASRVSSGSYFYILTTADGQLTRQMVIVK